MQVKYREDFFHLLNRLVNEGAIAFTLSLLFLPFKYKWRAASARSQEEKRKRCLIEEEASISWNQLTSQFPSFSQKRRS